MTGSCSKKRMSDLPELSVCLVSGSKGGFLRCCHGTESIKGDLMTGILEIVWAVPAVCVGHIKSG